MNGNVGWGPAIVLWCVKVGALTFEKAKHLVVAVLAGDVHWGGAIIVGWSLEVGSLAVEEADHFDVAFLAGNVHWGGANVVWSSWLSRKRRWTSIPDMR